MSPIGLVVAMLPEADCLHGHARVDETIVIGDGLLLRVCGVGPANARRSATHLADAGVCGLMSIGTAGALRPGLAAGDLLVPARVITAAGPLLADVRWRAHALARLTAAGIMAGAGDLAESERVLATTTEKSAFGTRHAAAAVDMESGAVLRVAAERALPAVILRVVLDAVDRELPEFLLRRTDAYGRARVAAILVDLLCAPGRLPALLRTAHAFRRAAATLRRIGAQLPALHPGHDAPAAPR